MLDMSVNVLWCYLIPCVLSSCLEFSNTCWRVRSGIYNGLKGMPNWFNRAHVGGCRWMREWFNGISGQPFLGCLGSMTQSVILLKDHHPLFFGHLLIKVIQWTIENLLLIPFHWHPSSPASWIVQHHQQAFLPSMIHPQTITRMDDCLNVGTRQFSSNSSLGVHVTHTVPLLSPI